MMTGVDMVHVPYRGGTAALVDLLSGQVQVRFGAMTDVDRVHQGRQAARAGGNHRDAFGSATGHPNGGRVRAWLTRRATGSASARPENTPAEIIDKLNREINAGLADPKIKARLADLGVPTLIGSPADFGKLIAEETEKWAKVIRTASIKPD